MKKYLSVVVGVVLPLLVALVDSYYLLGVRLEDLLLQNSFIRWLAGYEVIDGAQWLKNDITSFFMVVCYFTMFFITYFVVDTLQKKIKGEM